MIDPSFSLSCLLSLRKTIWPRLHTIMESIVYLITHGMPRNAVLIFLRHNQSYHITKNIVSKKLSSFSFPQIR